ncbi:hypothetical protein CC2G_012234 [Coprinopsis cinerea AmutBmut pab1-1]|nr:hypothetical protein CC2G_012234 [Coprinopsis cinerea AmutBmut pab1-1]
MKPKTSFPWSKYERGMEEYGEIRPPLSGTGIEKPNLADRHATPWLERGKAI